MTEKYSEFRRLYIYMPSLHMFFETHTHLSNLAFPKDLAAALFACLVLPSPTNSSSVVFAMPEGVLLEWASNMKKQEGSMLRILF